MGAENTYDFQDQMRDMSEVVDIIAQNSATLFSLISDGAPAEATKVEWLHDSLNSFQDVINNSGAIGTSDLTFTVTDGTKFRVNDIVSFEEDTGESYLETMRVTVVAGNLLTVTRQYNSQAKVSIADGDTVKIVSRPSLENAIGGYSESVDRSNAFNYTEIFTKFASVSRTQQRVKTHGVANELNYQVDMRLKELVLLWEKALIFGSKNVGSNTQPRTCGGLISEILNDANALKKNVNGALAASDIDDAVEDILSASGQFPNVAICHPKGARKISGFDSSGVQIQKQDPTTGRAVYGFRSAIPVGGLQNIVVVPQMPKDMIIVANTAKISKRWLDRVFDKDATEAAQDGFSRKIVSELTYEFKNAGKYHKLLYNFNL